MCALLLYRVVVVAVSLAVLQCYNESVIMLEILCNVRESPTVRIAIILIASDDALRAGCY